MKGYSILFVDDDKNLIAGIRRFLSLERDDIFFRTAFSAEEALELLKNEKFQIVVSDHKMPGMTGLTLMSIVRMEYPEIKRILFSAQVQENVFQEAEGVVHKYISKPCSLEDLILQIESLMEQKN